MSKTRSPEPEQPLYEQDEPLFESIKTYLARPACRRQLAGFGVEPDDAIQDVWVTLSSYSRRTTIRNMHAFVAFHARYLILRVIDREAKHNRKRDSREVR